LRRGERLIIEPVRQRRRRRVAGAAARAVAVHDKTFRKLAE
jgi:hypothetical protein